jgi:hypothetical protein
VAHCPCWHVVPLAQTSPQRLQLAFVPSWVSQPVVGSRSQSAKPAAQVNWHVPATQAAAVVWAVPQLRWQSPQWVASVAISVSQPLAAMPSQSAKPALQAKPQTPFTQVATAFGGAWQHWPVQQTLSVPQGVVSTSGVWAHVLVRASQVSSVQALPSSQALRSAQQPGIGSRPQVVPSQVAVLQGALGQGSHDVPQWSMSLSLTQSVPQRWKPASQTH